MSKATKNIVYCFIVLALFEWMAIHVSFFLTRREMQDDHYRYRKWMRRSQIEHLASLKDNYVKKRQAKQREYRKELEDAWGGGIMIYTKNPDFDIADMLRKAAIAACPKALYAEVNINNFNEFDVYINLSVPIDKKTASVTMKTLFMYCGKYVNSVSFVYQGNVGKTIDKDAIDTIKDWSSVSLETVSEKMYTP